MGFYKDQLLPRVTHVMLGTAPMMAIRRPALAGLSGTVVELGFGSGPNVELYPEEVDRVLAVDPAIVGRKLAAKRLANSTVPVKFIGLTGESLPLDDGEADCVLSTWSLCTIPDVETTLVEAHRVLRPGGKLHFLEHGLSPDADVARRQHRFNGLQRRLGGGCNMNRDMETLITEAGFDLETISNFTLSGPKPLGYMYCGIGVASG